MPSELEFSTESRIFEKTERSTLIVNPQATAPYDEDLLERLEFLRVSAPKKIYPEGVAKCNIADLRGNVWMKRHKFGCGEAIVSSEKLT